MTYDELVRGLRDSTYELQNEGRLVRAGLKTEQDTASIIERYAWLYSDEALGVVGEPAGEEQKRVRSAILQGIIERRTAAQQDRLTTLYAQATAPVNDEQVPFYTAQAQLVTDADPRRREALGDGLGVVMSEAEELSLELNAIVLQVIRDLGFDGYISFWSSLKEIDYGPLRDEVVRLARAGRERYRNWVEPRMLAAGRAFGDCPQAHLPYFRGLPEHNAAFTRERFEPAMRRTFETDPAVGWPLANMGRSMASAELWSFLIERIGHDPVWISEATGVSDAEAEHIASDLSGVDLMLFVRNVGKLDYELEVYAGDPLDAARGQQLYAGGLTQATGFVYDPRAWQFDRDPGFCSGDYLRAWIAEAALEWSLRERFGERWWATAEAGEWLRRQWRRGWEPEAEQTAAQTGGKPWSGDALLERLERRLPIAVR